MLKTYVWWELMWHPRTLLTLLDEQNLCSQKLMVDLLIHHTWSLLGKFGAYVPKKFEFFDNKFVSCLVKKYSKFSKNQKKETHLFPKQGVQYFSEENIKNVDVDRFYFPFNFDKTHWVGVCVDCPSSSNIILDCDIGLHNDNAISKELGSIALLFPYLLKQVGRFQTTKELKAFSVERSKSIPQNGNHIDFAVTAVLLMQAHAIGGLEVCRCITADVIPSESQRLVVMMYEEKSEQL